jgi:MATE family multidrug resistance protein
MVVSNASHTVMLFVDRLFLSRLGELHLAASMSGGLTMFMTGSFFVGTVGYVNAMVAQYFGAKRTERCAEATFQALVLAVASYPIMLALSPLLRYVFVVAGHGPEQIRMAYLYLRTLMLGSVFFVLTFALTGFFLGVGRTTVVMLANTAGMLINIPANYVLIFGRLGFPALGLQGAAIGTILGNATVFLILLAFYLRPANRRDFATHRARTIVFPALSRLLRFGIPAGVEMVLSVTAFNLFVQFMHSYGPDVAAAVTITFNWDILAFIPMLGMSHATTALVGQNIGARDYGEARRSAYLALRVSWIYSSSMVLLFVLATRALVLAFVPGPVEPADPMVSLAVRLLRLAAIYTLADSAQLVFAGALRGAGDTKWVMRTSIALTWVFSGTAIVLIRVFRVSPANVWLCFIGFVVVLGAAMFARFRTGKWQEIRLIQDDGSRPAQG